MSRKVFAPAILACIAVCLGAPVNRLSARPPDPFIDAKWIGKYQSASECNTCHTRPIKQYLDNKALEFVLLTEYSVWKTHDKHAQAYVALKGKRGQDIGRKLGDRDVTKPETGCMNCHAMTNLFGAREEKNIDGVSCGGCHGPSQEWRSVHDVPATWRTKSPAEKAKLGFRDLRDPEVKATLCMSCHVGNAAEGKVVTHAMFAAGHPPLPPIEIATFTRNQPQHWRDSKDVPYFRAAVEKGDRQVIGNYHLEDLDFQRTKLALIGGVVAFRETLQLALDRANKDAPRPEWVWPELVPAGGANDPKILSPQAMERWPEIALAHTDCYACHHDLKYPGFRQRRGYGYHLPGGPLIAMTPGRPTFREWPLALLKVAIRHAGKPDEFGKLEEGLRALARSSDAVLFGTPESVTANATALIDWCDRALAGLRSPDRYSKDALQSMLRAVADLYPVAPPSSGQKGPVPLPDYETARQLASLFRTAHGEWSGKATAGKEFADTLQEMTGQLDLEPYRMRPQRLQIILEIVKEASQDPDVSPADLKQFSDYLLQIGDEKLLLQLGRNKFLKALQDLSNQDFTLGLLKRADQLQELSNQEVEAQLQNIARYDPAEFLVRLKRLGALFGGASTSAAVSP